MPEMIIMPQLGESVVEGTVGKWLKKEGEQVAKYEPLLEVITDKVDTEIPSPAEGVVLKITVPEGQTVKAGTVIAWVGQAGESIPEGAPTVVATHGAPTPVVEAPPQAKIEAVAEKAAAPVAPTRAPGASPVVAKMAAEHGIDLSQVRGTGEGGRVTKKDLEKYIQEMKEPWAPREQEPGVFFREPTMAAPEAPPAAVVGVAPAEEVVELSHMRKAIAEHMVKSKRTAPHVTTVFEVDLSNVVAYREAHKDEFQRREGIPLTYTAFFVLAVVHGLKTVPQVNASFTEDNKIVIKRQINIGVAVAIEEGLIVPVIKKADEKTLARIAREVYDLATRARERQLTPDDVQSGTFTITNHGVSGSLFATPIINQPQAAILGVGAIQKRAVVIEGDAIAVRPMVYLSLTFDHRLLDGAIADRFVSFVKEYLEKFQGV